MTRELPFDGQAPWASQLDRGYSVTITPRDGGWLPALRIEPDKTDIPELEYVFVQSIDDAGTFTPGYVVGYGGVWSMPDEVPVPTWMRAAVERAGFRYDAEPNNVKFGRRDAERTHPDQTELVGI